MEKKSGQIRDGKILFQIEIYLADWGQELYEAGLEREPTETPTFSKFVMNCIRQSSI